MQATAGGLPFLAFLCQAKTTRKLSRDYHGQGTGARNRSRDERVSSNSSTKAGPSVPGVATSEVKGYYVTIRRGYWTTRWRLPKRSVGRSVSLVSSCHVDIGRSSRAAGNGESRRLLKPSVSVSVDAERRMTLAGSTCRAPHCTVYVRRARSSALAREQAGRADEVCYCVRGVVRRGWVWPVQRVQE